MRKHDSIKVLADSKLNTINNHISKAIDDNCISDSEFKLITEEIEKYKSMKADIRSNNKKIVKDNDKKQQKELEAFLKKGQEILGGKLD